MKPILSIIAIVFTCLVSFNISAQNPKVNQSIKHVVYKGNVDNSLTGKELKQLKEVYGDALEKDVLNIPQRLKDIKNILRNRVRIAYVPDLSKHKPCKLLSEVPLFDAYVNNLKRDVVFNQKTFNPLKYAFPFYGTRTEIYQVDNTDYYIEIQSQFYR